MNTTKRRYDNLDLLKAIAMLMVVSLHIPVWCPDFITGSYLTALPQYALRLVMEGVPIFVMVNGFLMFNKRELILEKHLKRMGKLALLLVVWSLLMVVGGMLVVGEQMSLHSIVVYFLQTEVNSRYTGVLWFLQSLLALYFVMPVVKKVYDTDYQCFKYFFYVVAFFTVGIDTLRVGISVLSSVMTSDVLPLIPTYLNKFSFLSNGQFLLFAMIGGILLKEKERIAQKKKLWVSLGLGAWVLSIVVGVILSEVHQSLYDETFNYGSIFMVFILIGWYAATLGYENQGKWYHKVISSIGENTLGIYFLHIFVISIVKDLLPYDSIGIRFLQWGIVYVASWIGSLIMKQIPVVRELVK